MANALKFTPSGGCVCIRLWRSEQRLLIDVADNGRGIPEDSLPHIFEEFYQAGNSGDSIGTGIGLALVNQIIRNLNGSISAESAPGHGTTFHIVLPMRRNALSAPLDIMNDNMEQSDIPTDNKKTENDATENTPAETESPEEHDTKERKRVLIVEDNSDIAAFIGKRLEERYCVDYADDGKAGFGKAREWMPDIIITDLMMPVMDGLELCRKIRCDELTCHIPIIVVTARVTETERIEGLKAGADAYLQKPFNSEELSTRIEKLLEQRAMLRRKFTKQLKDETKQTDGKDGKAQKHDEELMTELDRRFLSRLTDCVYQMLGGKKGVDVEAVASSLCMSYGQMNRKLTALTGYTPAQYIQRIKIHKAQRMLLARPELDFNCIAEQCGFSDYSNFVRAFRKVAGLTPTQFTRKE